MRRGETRRRNGWEDRVCQRAVRQRIYSVELQQRRRSKLKSKLGITVGNKRGRGRGAEEEEEEGRAAEEFSRRASGRAPHRSASTNFRPLRNSARNYCGCSPA